jgi:hypothetical protein
MPLARWVRPLQCAVWRMLTFTQRAVLAAVAASRAAHAQPAGAEEHGGVAAPGEESGRLDQVDEDTPGRKVLRGVLFVPKVVVELVLLPARGLVWTFDRFSLDQRYYDTFYNRDRTFGIIPTAAYSTGWGLTVGAKLISTNTFGQGEHLTGAGTYGGTYRLGAMGSLDTGYRLEPVRFEIAGNFDRRPEDAFFGIGNSGTGPQPVMPVDPVNPPNAFETFYRYQEARVVGTVGVSVWDGLAGMLHASYADLSYSPSTEGTPIGDVYNTMELTSFQSGVKHVYTEAELRWDTRRRVSAWEPVGLHAAGSLLDGYGGYVDGILGSGSFWHYGIDVQHYIRLGAGPRTLELRVNGEAVTGNLNEVPFSELPYLGGDFLRGYVYGRFRDRVAGFATVQYFWDISKYADAYVFTDFGRVYSSLDDLTLDDMRAGFGTGLEVHTDAGFVIEGYLATSINGGVVVSAAFSPIYDTRPRWR